MGIVLCQTHGRQGGPLCCEHVLDGVDGKATLLPADAGGPVLLQIDLNDDRSIMLDVALCTVCATAFHHVAGEVLKGAAFEDEGALPWLAPVCNPCFEAWRGCPTRGWK